jgi:hypothetical protein
MGQKRKLVEGSGSNGVLSELFDNRKKRAFTLNVDEDTYSMITRVAEQTGKTRPKVLAAFVKSAYDSFCEEVKAAGIKFNPDAPLSGNHKGSRNKPRKKR